MYSTFDIIVKPLIGAVIGYATNKIAIKMLFRPYREKKILGMKVPFTPGVIPRERQRIGKSLGEAVGENLLTTEVIEKELLKTEVITKIRESLMTDLLSRTFTLKEASEYVFNEKSDEVNENILNYFCLQLVTYFSDEKTKLIVKEAIVKYIIDNYGYDKQIGEIIPEKATKELIAIIKNNRAQLTDYLLKAITSEKVEQKINYEVQSLIEENFGSLGAMFVDSARISAFIINKIETVLGEDEVFDAILNAIEDALYSFREKSVGDIVTIEEFESYLDDISSHICKLIYEKATYENVKIIVNPIFEQIMQKEIKLSEEHKQKIEDSFEATYTNFIKNKLPSFLTLFDVSKLVEKEINSFSVEQVESLILNIVDKELNAITWFGGLLGFLIGIIYIFI